MFLIFFSPLQSKACFTFELIGTNIYTIFKTFQVNSLNVICIPFEFLLRNMASKFWQTRIDVWFFEHPLSEVLWRHEMRNDGGLLRVRAQLREEDETSSTCLRYTQHTCEEKNINNWSKKIEHWKLDLYIKFPIFNRLLEISRDPGCHHLWS